MLVQLMIGIAMVLVLPILLKVFPILNKPLLRDKQVLTRWMLNVGSPIFIAFCGIILIIKAL